MATSNNRDVELRIAATASGNEQIKKLADEVEALAKKGGSAAPEFQKLSAELDKIATQDAAIKQLQELDTQVAETSKALVAAQGKVKELGTAFEQQKNATDSFRTAQASAREEVSKTEEKLRSAKAELTTFRAESDQSARATNEYKVRLGELRKAVGDLQVELESNKALAGTKSDLKELEVETRKAERAFTAAKKEAEALQTQLKTQATAASEVTKALTDIGVETTDLGVAQKKLTSEVIATASAFKTAADEQTKYEAKLANIAAKNEVAVASAKKLGSETADAAKKSAAAQAEAASQYEAAALRVKLSQEEVAAKAKLAGQALENAFSTLNVRSADAIRTEIEGVKTALATLGNSGQLTGGQLKSAFEAAQVKVDALNRELAGIPAAAEKANASFGILRQSLSQLTAAFGAFEAARGFIDAANEIETLRRSLTLLLGDSKLAEAQIKFLRDTANNAGLSVGQLSKDFVNFTASLNNSGISLERQKDVFEATINAAGKLGISTDRVGLILQAFAQTANKGKVTLEELQGQLGESLPGALSIVAKGFGVTQESLLKLVKSGIDADTFFAAFIKGSKEAFGNGEKQVESFAAAWNRLKNALTEFSQRAADTTAFKALVGLIDALAANFNTVASAATVAAEAFALFKFVDYIKGFGGLRDATTVAKVSQDQLTTSITTGTAAKATDTSATIANTKATEANTAAKAASKLIWPTLSTDISKVAAAKAETTKQAGLLDKALGVASVGVGVFGTAARGLLGLIGGLPGVFVLTALNAKELGEAIAGQVAGWTGLKKEIADNEAKIKAFDDAQKASNQAQREAADAVKLQRAAMAGLNDEAKVLVGKFEEIQKKSGSTSAALEALNKELRFDDLSGIKAAAQALGLLQTEGKITADQIKNIFAGAAQGEDLLKFDTTVRAALSGVRGEAGLLRLALDGIGEESLARVGSSVRELETGFSQAFVKAANDTNTLREVLENLGASSDRTSTLLTKALSKEIEAASTRDSINDVLTKINELGQSGQVVGKDLSDLFVKSAEKALQLAKTEEDLKKIDTTLKEIAGTNPVLARAFEDTADKIKKSLADINPVLVQLQKDADLLGVKIKEGSVGGVEASLAAYERLKSSGKASTDVVREAFINLAKTATEAAGGVVPAWVTVEAQYRNVDLAVINLGESNKRYGGLAREGANAAIIAYGDAEDSVNSLTGATDRLLQKERELANQRGRSRGVDREGFVTDSSGNRQTILEETFLSVFNRLKSGGASEEQARAIASKYFPNQGKGVSMSAILEANNRAGYGGFGNLGTALNQEISDLARGGQLGKSPQQDNANQLFSLRTEFQNLTKELADLKNRASSGGYSNSVSGAAESLFNQVSSGSASLNSFLPGVSPFTLNKFSNNLGTYKSQLEQVRSAVQAGPTSTDTASVPRSSGSSGYTVTINLGGASRTINAASASDAQALVNLLQQIGAAASRSGLGGP
jgi:tape measure domain-containing protein